MNCKNCGATLKNKNKNCPYCGIDNPNYKEEIKNVKEEPKEEKKINNSNLGMIIIILLIILIITSILGIIK